MKRHLVQSSTINAIGYDEKTASLEVEFHANGAGVAAIWQYRPVAPEVAAKLCDPNESAGKVFFAQIKSDPNITAQQVGVTVEPTTGTQPIDVILSAPPIDQEESFGELDEEGESDPWDQGPPGDDPLFVSSDEESVES